jgi:E3 ubiquitin-protein ligase DRIP
MLVASCNRPSHEVRILHLKLPKGAIARGLHILEVTLSYCLQILSSAEASNHSSNKDTEGDSKELEDKAELWQPLNCLVEAANRTKSFRSSSQNPTVKGEQFNGSPSSTYSSKTKARENLQKSKIEDDKKDVPMPMVLPKRRGQGTARRRRELQAPAAAKPDPAAAQNEKKFSAIWFSLVASFDQ